MKRQSGEMISFDNKRQYFHEPLPPGQQRVVHVPILAPETTGEYRVEFDLVWEGVCWFRDRGDETPEVLLQVA